MLQKGVVARIATYRRFKRSFSASLLLRKLAAEAARRDGRHSHWLRCREGAGGANGGGGA